MAQFNSRWFASIEEGRERTMITARILLTRIKLDRKRESFQLQRSLPLIRKRLLLASRDVPQQQCTEVVAYIVCVMAGDELEGAGFH